MNVRKNIDYSQMYQAIDEVMVQKLQQMQLYTAIGKIVCSRSEKGAAVMASEYVRAYYPDVQGFSPRNLRRMRNFYRMYEDEPRLLSIAMELNWTQNVVIMEADLTMLEREWYLKTGCLFGWSKLELIEKIISGAHLEMVLDIAQETHDTIENGEEEKESLVWAIVPCAPVHFIKCLLLRRCRGRPKRGWAPWLTMCLPTFTAKRTARLRCWRRFSFECGHSIHIGRCRKLWPGWDRVPSKDYECPEHGETYR